MFWKTVHYIPTNNCNFTTGNFSGSTEGTESTNVTKCSITEEFSFQKQKGLKCLETSI